MHHQRHEFEKNPKLRISVCCYGEIGDRRFPHRHWRSFRRAQHITQKCWSRRNGWSVCGLHRAGLLQALRWLWELLAPPIFLVQMCWTWPVTYLCRLLRLQISLWRSVFAEGHHHHCSSFTVLLGEQHCMQSFCKDCWSNFCLILLPFFFKVGAVPGQNWFKACNPHLQDLRCVFGEHGNGRLGTQRRRIVWIQCGYIRDEDHQWPPVFNTTNFVCFFGLLVCFVLCFPELVTLLWTLRHLYLCPLTVRQWVFRGAHFALATCFRSGSRSLRQGTHATVQFSLQDGAGAWHVGGRNLGSWAGSTHGASS